MFSGFLSVSPADVNDLAPVGDLETARLVLPATSSTCSGFGDGLLGHLSEGFERSVEAMSMSLSTGMSLESSWRQKLTSTRLCKDYSRYVTLSSVILNFGPR